jgi:DNA-3-methyladenine glycosylase
MLPRRFYTTDPVTLARALLGQRLVRTLDDGTRLAGIIVETEAYLGVEDMAAHTYGGRRTARNEAMYLPGGHAYVYFTYGMHHCMNVVAGKQDDPVAVLLRALEPTEGIERMLELRHHKPPPPSPPRRSRSRSPAHPLTPPPSPPPPPRDLTRGPARLCQAMAIDKSLNALDLTKDRRLFIERAAPTLPDDRIGASPRIGVDYAGSWAEQPLRFFMKGSRFLSGPSRLNVGPSPRPPKFTLPRGNQR